jgi:integrase
MKKRQACSGLEWPTMIGLANILKGEGLLFDYRLIYVGSYFGLRIGDLLSIRWKDVLEKGEIILVEQKTKKNRRITINPKAADALQFCAEELHKRNKFNIEGYVFANRWGGKISVSYINKRLKAIFKKHNIRVKNASSHTLRKTFGKRIYEQGNSSEAALIYLSEIFSHSSVSVTRQYIGLTDEHIENVYLSM